MSDLDKRIDSILRSFNIDRSDIKELWSTGRFGTIAVPADRYKQYYDTIKHLQAQVVERERLLHEVVRVWNTEDNNETVVNLYPIMDKIETAINKAGE